MSPRKEKFTQDVWLKDIYATLMGLAAYLEQGMTPLPEQVEAIKLLAEEARALRSGELQWGEQIETYEAWKKWRSAQLDWPR